MRIRNNKFYQEVSVAIQKMKNIIYEYFRVISYQDKQQDAYKMAEEKWRALTSHYVALDDQYDAILRWIKDDKEKPDPWHLVKEGLWRVHQQHFAALLNQMNQEYECLRQTVNRTLLTVEQRIQEDCQYLAAEQKTLQDRGEQLAVYCQQLAKYPLDAAMLDHDYQFRMKQLMRIAMLAKKNMSTLTPLCLLKKQAMPPSICFYMYRQEKMATKLATAIRAYEAVLRAEPWYVKCIKFFSRERWRRWDALSDYHQSVSSIVEEGKRFYAATAWLRRVQEKTPSQSRFYQDCVLSFKQDIEQLSFERLPAMRNRLEGSLQEKFQQRQQAMMFHHERMVLWNQLLREQHQQTALLDAHFFATIEKICLSEETVSFGFLANAAHPIITTQAALSRALAQYNEKKQQRMEQMISIRIAHINRNTNMEVMHALAAQTATERHNQPASLVLTQSIDKVIADTKMYAAHGMNTAYMGLTRASTVIQLFASGTQKQQFSRVKETVLQEAASLMKEVEEKYVTELERGLNTGSLLKKLDECRHVYQQYLLLQKRDPDGNVEKSYQQLIKEKRVFSLTLHEKGTGKLKQFVDDVMVALLGAATMTMDIRRKKMQIALSWEQADMLVVLYGVEAQITEWQTRAAPYLLQTQTVMCPGSRL